LRWVVILVPVVDHPTIAGPAQALLCAKEYRCAAEVVTIIAMLSSPNIFFVPFEQRDEVCEHGQASRPTDNIVRQGCRYFWAGFVHAPDELNAMNSSSLYQHAKLTTLV
jgi:HrpA-like RNA helicase